MPVGVPPPTATFMLVAAWAGATAIATLTVVAASDQLKRAIAVPTVRAVRPRGRLVAGDPACASVVCAASAALLLMNFMPSPSVVRNPPCPNSAVHGRWLLGA